MITFEETLHDFGEVSPRTKHLAEFRFKNTGTGILKIQRKIRSTCGCTVPSLSKTDYGPGEEGVIKVTYTAGISPAQVTKTITVNSNATNSPAAKLSIKARTVQKVICEPYELNLLLNKDNGACPPLTLRSLDKRAFSVTKAYATGNAITVQVDPSLQAGEMTLQPHVDLEKLRARPLGYLVLTLTHPERKELRIRYNTLREYQFNPPSIMLLDADPGKPVTRRVLLVNNYNEDFDIQSVSSDRGLIRLTQKEKIAAADARKTSYRLTLSITLPETTAKPVNFSDTLSVQLTDGTTLKMHCRGYNRKMIRARPRTSLPPGRKRPPTKL